MNAGTGSLEADLETERARSRTLESELKRKDEEIRRIKNNAAYVQARIEEEEEFMTNNLLKRLETLKKEKETLALQVETEEEFMTNTLQKKLDQLRKEKVELENHLEVEQEYIVNKLQKQLCEVTRQKNALERKLNEGRSSLIAKLEQSVGDYKESLQPGSCPTERQGIRQLETQIRILRESQNKAELEADEYRGRCNRLATQLEEMQKEKFLLQVKARRFREKLEQLQLEREREHLEGELRQEKQFNQRAKRRSDKQAKSSGGCSSISRSRSASEIKPQRKTEAERARSASLGRGMGDRTQTPRAKDLRRHTEHLLRSPLLTPNDTPSPLTSPRSLSPLPPSPPVPHMAL